MNTDLLLLDLLYGSIVSMLTPTTIQLDWCQNSWLVSLHRRRPGHSSVDVLHHVACSVATTGPRSRAPRGCWRRRSCHCTRSELRVRLVPAAALQRCGARPLHARTLAPAVPPRRRQRARRQRRPRRRARSELRMRLVPEADLQVGAPRRVDDDAARRRRHPTSCAGRWRRSSRST